MPKRPYPHTLGDKAHTQIRLIFLNEGWAVSDIHPDYGEDLLVRIFNKETSHPLYFFVQSKGVEDLKKTKYLTEDGTSISFPIETKHIEDWQHFLEPVVLVVWDEATGKAYWQIIQDALEGYKQKEKGKEFHIRIPVRNTLNKNGIKIIAMRTIKRFNRYEQSDEMTNILCNYFEKTLNVKIDYDEEEGIASIEYPEGDIAIQFLFCGKALKLVEKIAYLEGVSEETLSDPLRMQSYIYDLLKKNMEERPIIFESDKRTNKLFVKDRQGNLLHTFRSSKEMLEFLRKIEEIEAYDEYFR